MPATKPDFSEFQEAEQLRDLRQALSNSQRALRAEKRKTDVLVAATVQAAKEAMMVHGRVKPVPAPPRDRRRGKPEVALWHLTDWQGSKVTPTYNSQVMRDRILRYCARAKKITDVQRADHPVRECVIMLGGDLIEGLFNYPTQPFEVDATLFGQYTFTSRLVVEVIRYALADHEKVTVIEEDGNHGRLGSTRAAIPRSDNVDLMICHTAREVLQAAGEKRLTWGEPPPEDVKRVEIGNYKALLCHGNEIGRMGFASKNTIVKHCNDWKAGGIAGVLGENWPFRDVYFGHYHRPGEEVLADGDGSIYWTGSPETDNRYAGTRHAASARPSQRLHFIEPEAGEVTAQYAKVWLDR